jgi:hypothetical protein
MSSATFGAFTLPLFALSPWAFVDTAHQLDPVDVEIGLC